MEADEPEITAELLPKIQKLLKHVREGKEADALRATQALTEEIGRIKEALARVPGVDIPEEEQLALETEAVRKAQKQAQQLESYLAIISSVVSAETTEPHRQQQ